MADMRKPTVQEVSDRAMADDIARQEKEQRADKAAAEDMAYQELLDIKSGMQPNALLGKTDKLMTSQMIFGLRTHLTKVDSMFDGLERELYKQHQQMVDQESKIESLTLERNDLLNRLNAIKEHSG